MPAGGVCAGRKIFLLDFATLVVTREDLIISKLLWAKESASELQLRDVQNLLATEYDSQYLRHWTRELGLDNLLQRCLE
jgi:hypothetical protein